MKKFLSFVVLLLAAVAYYFGVLPFDLNTEDLLRYPVQSVLETNGGGTEGLEVPKSPQGLSERILKKKNYTVSFNKDNNIPNWVAWTITADELIERESRTDDFRPDPELLAGEAVTTQDYVGSGYDRGHMCPAADNRYHWRAMDESFYMTNICPQNHSLNAGAWNALEQQCRRWVADNDAVYVVCGPIMYEGEKARYIGKEHKVRVPDAFFKVVLWGCERGTPQAAGFIMKNASEKKALRNYSCTVDYVEKVTGIDFFYHLDDQLEEVLESMKPSL